MRRVPIAFFYIFSYPLQLTTITVFPTFYLLCSLSLTYDYTIFA